MFGCLFQIRHLNKIFKLLDFVGKVLHTDISYGIPCLFIFCRPCFGLQSQSEVEKYIKARYAIGNVSMKDLSKKIKEFEKFVKVPHLKNTSKHEPTLSYFHLVECLRKCMMRCGEKNHHVHDSYGKEMASSSDVKDTDEDKGKDKSKNSIARSFDEPSAENLMTDCNIVNATKELNYDEHIKPSANVI